MTQTELSDYLKEIEPTVNPFYFEFDDSGVNVCVKVSPWDDPYTDFYGCGVMKQHEPYNSFGVYFAPSDVAGFKMTTMEYLRDLSKVRVVERIMLLISRLTMEALHRHRSIRPRDQVLQKDKFPDGKPISAAANAAKRAERRKERNKILERAK